MKYFGQKSGSTRGIQPLTPGLTKTRDQCSAKRSYAGARGADERALPGPVGCAQNLNFLHRAPLTALFPMATPRDHFEGDSAAALPPSPTWGDIASCVQMVSEHLATLGLLVCLLCMNVGHWVEPVSDFAIRNGRLLVPLAGMSALAICVMVTFCVM